ncbi:hypothetical protein yc1106_07471 [Curvularia clavata]|uniref:Uncharacterized protein n=1 Tax=Curvularia clavata TaxID=95742 RepID=A0A9Q9DUV0_CURCL|nr:hypothetical protein yc1106_07471 [Curvularia clavata]
MAKHINDEMSDVEKHTLKIMQSKDAKRCPHCQMVVEKDGGCNSMFCGGCHKYFNWASAASAIAGAKKPEVHFIRTLPHYTNYGPYTCEADGVV